MNRLFLRTLRGSFSAVSAAMYSNCLFLAKRRNRWTPELRPARASVHVLSCCRTPRVLSKGRDRPPPTESILLAALPYQRSLFFDMDLIRQ